MSQARKATLSALSESVCLGVMAVGAVAVQIVGTFVATLTFEATLDGITYEALNLIKLNGTSGVSTATATGIWSGVVGGCAIVRVRISAYTSGEATVTIANAPEGGKIAAGGGGGGGGTSSTFGSAVPSDGTAAGFEDVSGNMAMGKLDASRNLLVAGTLTTTPPAAATSTLSNVNSSATNVTALAANAARLGFELYNDSAAAANVKLGATASASSFTKRLLQREFFSTRDLGVNYTGRIDAIWDSADGAMRVTELT